MRDFVWIGLGGWLGAVFRYVADRWVIHATGGQFPFGTLVINLLGCFVLGLLGTLVRDRLIQVPREVWLFATYGFIGAFTTFSTFGFETLRLMEDGRLPAALANVLASAAGGILACYAGAVIARHLAG